MKSYEELSKDEIATVLGWVLDGENVGDLMGMGLSEKQAEIVKHVVSVCIEANTEDYQFKIDILDINNEV